MAGTLPGTTMVCQRPPLPALAIKTPGNPSMVALIISRRAPRSFRILPPATPAPRAFTTVIKTSAPLNTHQRPAPRVVARRSQSPNLSFLRRFFGPSASPEEMSAAKTKAQGIIDDNAVAVFSKSYCPYCKQSKELLSSLGVKAHIIELDEVDDGSAIQAALEEITGQRTVPNIFIDKKHIGGNSDLQSKKAELPSLLKAAGAL